MSRQQYHGKFAGLTARSVAGLMKADESTAKRYLHKLEDDLGGLGYMELHHIGELVHRYLGARDWKIISQKVNKF